jgi:hypothetical protein
MFRLVGICLASMSLAFFSIAALLRLLPHFLSLIQRALRVFLILSFRFYHLVLTCIAPTIQQLLNVDILVGSARIVASLLLSLVLGLLFILVTGWIVTGWSIVLFLLHGLFVGLAWDEIGNPAGLQLGVKIE